MRPDKKARMLVGLAVIFSLAAVVGKAPATGQSAVFDQPLLLTSAGQSPDVQLAVVLAKRAGIENRLVKLATAQDLDGIKTLGLVVGASLKGLGAAGIDTAKEKARVKELLAAAVGRSIPILFLHLGGEQRRGELTDAMIMEYLPAARMAVIVKSADNDGLFSRVCKENDVPLTAVEKTAEAADILKCVFRPKG